MITNWRKSSYSDRDFENCVEVGDDGHQVGIRDTKQRHLAQQPELRVSYAAFAALVDHVR